MARKFIEIETHTNRTTGFLLGLVVALTLLLVALEYKTGGAQDDMADTDDDDLSQELDLMPQKKQDDMIPFLKPGAAPRAITKNIKKVDVVPETEVPAKLDQADGDADKGDGGGQTGSQTDGDDETTALPQQPTDLNDNPLNLRVVEKLPEFPGGMVEFMKWITKNLRYPPAAQRQKIQGQVKVAFIIGKDGTVSELKVVKSADPLLDSEALRVLRMMPKWKPGQDKGKPCMTYFCIPVNFKI